MSTGLPITRSTRRVDHSAAVGQTVFDFGAPLFDPLDIDVDVSIGGGPFTRLAWPADYSVFIAAGAAYAQITLAVAPRTDAGAPATIVRLDGRRTHERVADVTRAGAIHGPSLETELDRQTVTLQELRRDLDDGAVSQAALTAGLGRALRVPEAVAELPAAALRPGKTIGFGLLGEPQLLAPLVPVAAPTTLLVATTVAAQTLTLSPVVTPAFRTLGYAAVGDGGAGLWVSAGAEPTHAAKMQTADGGWWELKSEIIAPEQIGGAVDAAIRRAFDLRRPFLLNAYAGGKLAIDPTAGDDLAAAAEWLAGMVLAPPAREVFRSRVYMEIAGWHTVSTAILVNGGRAIVDIRGAGGSGGRSSIKINSLTYALVSGVRHRLTVTLDAALPAACAVGQAIALQNVSGDNDARAACGAHIIETISGDRLTVTMLADWPRAPTSPTTLDYTSDGWTGRPRCQLIWNPDGLVTQAGGWTGGAQEGFVSCWFGGRVSMAYLALAFSATGGVGTAHDMVYVRGAGSTFHGYDRCIIAGGGATGRCLRGYGGQLHLNKCFVGAAGKAARTIETTSGTETQWVASEIGTSGDAVNVVEAGEASYQVSLIAGGNTALQVTQLGRIHFNKSDVSGAVQPFDALMGGIYMVNARAYRYTTLLGWSAGGYIYDRGQLTADGSGADCATTALPDQYFNGGAWYRTANRTPTLAGVRLSLANNGVAECALRGQGGVIRVSCASLPQITATLSVDLLSPATIVVGLSTGTEMVLGEGAIVAPLNAGKVTMSVYLRGDGKFVVRALNEDGGTRVLNFITEGEVILDGAFA